MSIIETAIVPVAGLGTRLLPISQATPKELLPVGRKPVLQYIAEELGNVGVRRIVLVTSPAKPQIGSYFQADTGLTQRLMDSGQVNRADLLWSESRFADIQIECVTQHQQCGLGHAILCAEPKVAGQPVIIALGDCILGIQGQSDLLNRMVTAFRDQSADAVIAFETVSREKVSQYGIADPGPGDDVFQLRGIVEKPPISEAPSQLAVAARYIFTPQLFESLRKIQPGQAGEIQLTDAIADLIAQGGRVLGVRTNDQERRFDIGNFESFTRAFIEFALSDPDLRETVLDAVRQEADRP